MTRPTATVAPRQSTPGRARRLTARELAAALGLPSPTDEQVEVIEAPLTPAVIVAGAGSGKTETITSRVVWLVATGAVAPDRILGLTFSTKAAAELGQRLASRLARLRGAVESLPAGVGTRAFAGSRDEPAELGEPTVLTYHSYAARLIGEHALRIAVEPSSRLLTPASTWQLAERVVHSYDGPMDAVVHTEGSVIDYVLSLAAELGEQLTEPAELADWTADFIAGIEAYPRKGKNPQPFADVKKVLEFARERAQLVPLIERYRAAKLAAGAVDFGDQLALAARIGRDVPVVGEIERSRYDLVLLDEYQDTSEAQLVLMRSLYGGGHPVTAVGDPCQSIYGWRGASAGNLARFPRDFPRRDGVSPVPLPLLTSFRNDRTILAVANAVSAPLRATGPGVGALTPGPAAADGAVRAGLFETADEEIDWVAGEIADLWTADAADRAAGGGRSVAVLVRRRSAFPALEAALRERGLPVELVGLGGLLATPEVRDLVATLQAISDPGASTAALRLLAGARWRIGPRDLVALRNRARSLVRRRTVEPPADNPANGTEPGIGSHIDMAAVIGDPVEEASLIEALDDLGPAAAYSPEGYRRMVALGRELRALRRRTAAALPELVADVERTLGLDVEVVAAGGSRVHLDRFLDVAAQFAQDADVATLGSFLAFLRAAEAEERGLDPGEIVVDGDRVQVLTMHAAKGLEWDVVAVVGMSGGVFPDGNTVTGAAWLTRVAELPHPLRGDAADLPVLDLDGARDQKDVNEARKALTAALRERGELDERRLAYVALTRARQLLLCSGCHWEGELKKPHALSPFLTEVAAAGADIAHWAPAPPDDAPNPLLAEQRSVGWPADPLRNRRAAVTAGADLVRAALADRAERAERADSADRPDRSDRSDRAEPPADASAGAPAQDALFDPDGAGWDDEVELLLAERAAPRAVTIDVPLPGELSVTALVTLRRDPDDLAYRIRRPMPARPAPLARRGTAFHAWLEQRFGGGRLLDVEELPGSADATPAPDVALAELQEQFLASPWADRRPVEIEVPFETRLGGVVIRGRMDAVFRDEDGGYTVVDWKTGTEPTGAAAAATAVQLAAYRLAWAALADVPPGSVRAAFHYVRSGRTTSPADLLDDAGLHALIRSVPTA